MRNKIEWEIEEGALGDAVRTARINKDMSQEQLAELVGITPTHLKHIESEHRKPSIEVLFRLTKILNLSLDALIFSDISSYDAHLQQLKHLLPKCSENELLILYDIAQSLLSHRKSS